jgi:thymidylate kinase
MKRIIVEGIDGSGKSTVIHMLLERVAGVRLVEGFKHSGFSSYPVWLNSQLNGSPSPSTPIHDRFFYSELVYGPILRQRIDVTPHTYEETIRQLRRSAMLIYCRPPLKIIRKSSTVKPQMEGVDDNLAKIYEEYENLMMDESEYYRDRFLLWDFTRHHFINYMGPRVREYLHG